MCYHLLAQWILPPQPHLETLFKSYFTRMVDDNWVCPFQGAFEEFLGRHNSVVQSGLQSSDVLFCDNVFLQSINHKYSTQDLVGNQF